jgi:hypothetical protein
MKKTHSYVHHYRGYWSDRGQSTRNARTRTGGSLCTTSTPSLFTVTTRHPRYALAPSFCQRGSAGRGGAGLGIHAVARRMGLCG